MCRVVGAGHPGDGIDTMNAVLDQKEFDVVFFTGRNAELDELSRRNVRSI